MLAILPHSGVSVKPQEKQRLFSGFPRTRVTLGCADGSMNGLQDYRKPMSPTGGSFRMIEKIFPTRRDHV